MKVQVELARYGKIGNGKWAKRAFMLACLAWITFSTSRQLLVVTTDGPDTHSFGKLATMPDAEWARQILAYFTEDFSPHCAHI